MVSVFCRQDPDMVAYAAARGIDIRNVSFYDFVCKARLLNHVHLLPQVRFVCDSQGNALVDFVGRFERLEKDFALISERLGIGVTLGWHNPSSRGNYQSYYDDSSRRLVAEHYMNDIETFGYDF